MLTQTYQLIDSQTVLETRQVSAFEAGELSGWPGAPYNHNTRWQGDPERFQLVINEEKRIETPVNRADADYWIEQAKARALGVGEVIGRVAVAR